LLFLGVAFVVFGFRLEIKDSNSATRRFSSPTSPLPVETTFPGGGHAGASEAGDAGREADGMNSKGFKGGGVIAR